MNINPDKYVRKAVYDVVNDMVIDGKTIKCFDSRITASSSIKEYVLLTSQTKSIDKATKCGYRWETSLLIEIFTKYSSAGNTGSRVFLNDIEEEIYNRLDNLQVDNFEVLIQNITTEASNLETVTTTENIFRSFIRLNLTLN